MRPTQIFRYPKWISIGPILTSSNRSSPSSGFGWTAGRLGGGKIGDGTGRRAGGLYLLEQLHVPRLTALSSLTTPASSVFSLWHSRLGHVYESRFKYGVSFGQLGHLPPTDISSCLGCQLGKHTALPLTSSTTQIRLMHLLSWYILLLFCQKVVVHMLFYLFIIILVSLGVTS